jgi:hypothetical protein
VRLKRTVVAIVVGGLVGLAASVAMAQSLDGGCTVTANSDLDSTTMTDASRSNPFDVDPEGAISWSATSPAAITDNTWVINIDIGGFAVPVAKGGDPNTAGTLTSIDSKSIPELVQRLKDQGTAGADLLLGLRGIYRVFGEITGSSTCSGDAYVNVEGNPLTETPGQVAAGLAAVGFILTMLSGMAKRE